MSTKLSRIIKYGLQGFLRNGWLSVATIAVILLVLLTFEGITILGVVGQIALNDFQEKIDISVYLKPNVAEDDIIKLERAIKDLKEVKGIDYVSKEQAFDIFKEKHKNEAAITGALAELDANPLLASLNIKAKDPGNYPAIANYLESDNLKNIVEKVTYQQNKIVIDRLVKIIETLKKIGFIIIFFLSAVAALVIFNTIRIAIYSNREEISILRLVGASNSFINGPYLVNAFLYGLIAAVSSIILSIPAMIFLSPYIAVFVPSFNLSHYFLTNILLLFSYQLLFGSTLGIVSSGIAIRRYLKI